MLNVEPHPRRAVQPLDCEDRQGQRPLDLGQRDDLIEPESIGGEMGGRNWRGSVIRDHQGAPFSAHASGAHGLGRTPTTFVVRPVSRLFRTELSPSLNTYGVG